jgi:hypothetical protein
MAAWLLVRDALGVKSIDRKSKTLSMASVSELPLDWCAGKIPVSSTEAIGVSWRKTGGKPSVQLDLPPGWKKKP